MKLEEVAKRAGVSTATVSRVLNDIDVVKSHTKARVLKAVRELNYHPNLHARSLAGGKSRTIGMIVSNLANPFFFDIFGGVESAARDQGYEVVIANTGYEPERLVAAVQMMIGRRVAGLAVVVSEMDADLMEELRVAGIPVVFYDVGRAEGKISKISVNYRAGIERIVEHLHGLGHTRLAFAGHHAALGPTSERQRAFVDAVTKFSPAIEWMAVPDSDSLQGGRAAARAILESGFEPTGIVCVNDVMAVGVLRELREVGRRVPEDVSVTGFDDIERSDYCEPALTTAHVARDAIGEQAFHLLGLNGGEGEEAREIVVEPELLVRGSTGRAKGSAA